MIYYQVEQGTSEWFDLRKGVPTASRFDMILTPAQGKKSAQQRKLICELIGETMSLVPDEGAPNYTNRAMDWGRRCEAEARHYYQLERSVAVGNGGFCASDLGIFGASPDGVVGLVLAESADPLPIGVQASIEGALELKCPQPTTQAEYLLDGTLPDAYRWQVHGHLLVTGAQWCDFLSYCPGLPPLLLRVEPGPDTELLGTALAAFWVDYQAALAKVRGPEAGKDKAIV